ncbi:hypothetical protein IV203_004213 [Nitzschia inconspicua]|uniref:Uncharacterized protein n=1 Tax=Nitzschia inconspicua TaxID=303405 RepID=A0A9K3L3M6_9STRA|nr:hypothetical protein IV203_004213 [Nitzschia inconspicua]
MADHEEDFAVWRPANLISLDEYHSMRKTAKDLYSSNSSITKGDACVMLEERSTHSTNDSSKASASVSCRRRGRRRSLKHVTSMDESLHSVGKPAPPPRPSPRTTPNQRLRKKKYVKQQSSVMKELIDLLESPPVSPATSRSRKYRASEDNV